MRITPSESDFRMWAACAPIDGDLVFISNEHVEIAGQIPVPAMTIEEARAHSWTLDLRSWYGYALNQAAICVWFPRGMLENLHESLLIQLADEQIRLGLPTLLSHAVASTSLVGKLLRTRDRHWITSLGWSRLSESERIAAVESWAKQNELQHYSSVSFDDLPIGAQAELKRLGYDRLLNRYPDRSGPNCFAAVAGAIAEDRGLAVSRQWLHWEPLARFLQRTGYREIGPKTPQVGDVLVFFRNEKAVHAAYCLGEGFYFEKPGQDFYEPYRVESFLNWDTEWPSTSLSIWRRSHE